MRAKATGASACANRHKNAAHSSRPAGQQAERRTKHTEHLHAPMTEVQRARKRTKRAKEAAQINSSKDRGEKQWARYKTESVICLCLIATAASSSADASRALLRTCSLPADNSVSTQPLPILKFHSFILAWIFLSGCLTFKLFSDSQANLFD